MQESNGDEATLQQKMGSEKLLTPSRYLVLASCFVIGSVCVCNILLQAYSLRQGTWVGVVRWIGQTATHSLGSLLCLWLAWRSASWLSAEKICVALLVVANALLPTLAELFIVFDSTIVLYSAMSIDLVVPMVVTTFGTLVLLIGGYQFFGRFVGLQFVSSEENPSRRRLTIQSFFLLTSCCAIPLAIDIWIRRNQSPIYSISEYSFFLFLWLGARACEIVIHGFLAMMFCLRRSKLPNLFAGLFFALVLKGGLYWLSFNEMISRTDSLSPNVATAFRETMVYQFVVFGGELIFIPFGFWVIRSAGYELRIVDSKEVFGREIDGEHPLGERVRGRGDLTDK